MKKLVSLLLLFTTITILSCEGPQGPPGADGGLLVSSAFEIEIDFTAGNNYEYFEPYGFQLYPYDMTLVYIWWENVDGLDVWRLLPQYTEFNDGSTLIYNYDFTQVDVRFFLDGTTNFGTLDPSWTQNQVFRVVVIPADNVDNIDVSNIYEVMQVGNIENFERL